MGGSTSRKSPARRRTKKRPWRANTSSARDTNRRNSSLQRGGWPRTHSIRGGVEVQKDHSPAHFNMYWTLDQLIHRVYQYQYLECPCRVQSVIDTCTKRQNSSFYRDRWPKPHNKRGGVEVQKYHSPVHLNVYWAPDQLIHRVYQCLERPCRR
jgi:hypothetical protein